jgi:hypothetical protein
MYFGYSIGIYDCNYKEFVMALGMVMKTQGFFLVDHQPLQDISGDKLTQYAPDGLSIRNFLIASNQNKWCRVYPSVQFNAVQDLAHKLSEKLNCPVMIFLVDDSSGWGYELYQQGHLIDGFHTTPMDTPTLEEKEDKFQQSEDAHLLEDQRFNQIQSFSMEMEDIFKLKTRLLEMVSNDQLTSKQKEYLERKLDLALVSYLLPTSKQIAQLPEKDLSDPIIFEQTFSITPNQHAKLEKYIGIPSVIAEIFDVDRDKITTYLTRVESELKIRPEHENMRNLFKLLNIEHGDAEYYSFFPINVLDSHWVNIDDWHHLVFQR